MKQIEFEKLFADAAEKNGVASAARLHNFAPNLEGMMIELRNKLNTLPAEQPSEDLEGLEDSIIEFLGHVPENEPDHSETLYTYEQMQEIARHFANWQKEQMMKGFCYETKVYQDEEGDGIDTPIESWLALENNEITNLPNIGLKDGDKVKILIIKEDEQ